MPKINEKLQAIRNLLIWDLYQQQETAEDIGIIFSMTTSQIYNILKTLKSEERSK